MSADKIVQLPIGSLKEHPNNFFRTLEEEELAELAASIEVIGLTHPVVVVTNTDESYTIISGHQRTRAIRILEWETVPCVVREYASTEDAEEALIDANVRTRGLSSVEMAKSIRRKKQLMGNRQGRPSASEKEGNNCHHSGQKTREVIANEMGISPRRVDQIDKLNDLIPELERMVDKGELTATAAYEFACLPPEKQLVVVVIMQDLAKKCSVAEAKRIRAEMEDKVRTAQAAASKNAEAVAEKTMALTKAQNHVAELQRTVAQLQQKPKAERLPEDDALIKALEKDVREAQTYIDDLTKELDEKESALEAKDRDIDRLKDAGKNAELLRSGMARFVTIAAELCTYRELSADAADLSQYVYSGFMRALTELESALPEIKRNLQRAHQAQSGASSIVITPAPAQLMLDNGTSHGENDSETA